MQMRASRVLIRLAIRRYDLIHVSFFFFLGLRFLYSRQATLRAGCSVGGTPSYTPVYPAASAFVTAVGGTGLARPTSEAGPACRTFGNLSQSGCVTEQVISAGSQVRQLRHY